MLKIRVTYCVSVYTHTYICIFAALKQVGLVGFLLSIFFNNLKLDKKAPFELQENRKFKAQSLHFSEALDIGSKFSFLLILLC
jgi:hypothetical protein